MDVVIARMGAPYAEGANVFVDFIAIGKTATQSLSVQFRVQYAWGASAAQRNTAIMNGARAAKTAYETAHEVTLPAINELEILV